VRRWSREAGISFRRHSGVRVDHSREVKEAACLLLAGGDRPARVAKKLNVPFPTVAGWSQKLGLQYRRRRVIA